MIACSSTALANLGSAWCYYVPYFREMRQSTVRAIHSSMLLQNSVKVNNRAILFPNLKVIPLLPHIHTLKSSPVCHRVCVPSLDNCHRSSVTAAFPNRFFHNYLPGNSEIFDKCNCYKFKYRTSFISNLCLQASCGHSLLVTLRDKLSFNSSLTTIMKKIILPADPSYVWPDLY